MDKEREQLEAELLGLKAKRKLLTNEMKVAMVRGGHPDSPYTRTLSIVQKELDDLNKQIEQVETKLRSLPIVKEEVSVRCKLTGRWKYEVEGRAFSIVFDGVNRRWFVDQDLYDRFHSAVLTDANNIPTQIKRFKQDSDTHGEVWVYIYNTTLDIQPILEEIKPRTEPKRKTAIEQEAERKGIIEGMVNKTMEGLIKTWKCPQCGYENIEGLTLHTNCCMNCTRPREPKPQTRETENTSKGTQNIKKRFWERK